MFDSDLREARKGVIDIKELRTLRSMIHYIYTGEQKTEKVSGEKVSSLCYGEQEQERTEITTDHG